MATSGPVRDLHPISIGTSPGLHTAGRSWVRTGRNPIRKEGPAMMIKNRPLLMTPAFAAWNTVARFDDYETAQRAVDRVSDDGFPVETLDIVGSALRLVERVTGRLTKARAAGAGAISGAWAGLMIGILLGLFTTGAWLGVVVAGVAIGAAFGAAFGFAAHAATRGQRDFSSIRDLSASRYDLIAREGTADRARTMLGQSGLLPAQTCPVPWWPVLSRSGRAAPWLPGGPVAAGPV